MDHGSAGGLSSSSWESPEERNRVHFPAVAPNLEMEVGASGISRMPTQGDNLSAVHFFAIPHTDGGEVGVHRHDPSSVIQPDHLPIPTHGSGEPDFSPGHGSHFCSVRNPDVHPSMKIRPPSLEPKSER